MAKIREGLIGAGMSGSVQGLSYVRTRQGTQVRGRPQRRAPLSPGKLAQAERLQRIGAFWGELGLEEIALWRRYAEDLVAAAPALERRPMPAYNAFLALATRLLMLEPGRATIPLLPPAHRFLGDAVGVSVSPSPDGSFGRGGRGERSGTLSPLPLPPLQEEPLGEGVLFTCTRANAEGVLTELLAQPLASVGRAPQAGRYASRGFAGFEAAGESVLVPLPRGWKACAYRFVEEATGQASPLVPCGVVRAG